MRSFRWTPEAYRLKTIINCPAGLATTRSSLALFQSIPRRVDQSRRGLRCVGANRPSSFGSHRQLGGCHVDSDILLLHLGGSLLGSGWGGRRDLEIIVRIAPAFVAAIFDDPFVRRHLFAHFILDQLVNSSCVARTSGLPERAFFAAVIAKDTIEEAVLVAMIATAIAAWAPCASVAFGRMRQAAWVRLAHFAALLARAGNANIFFFAAVAGHFYVFHFAHHAANFLAMGLTATTLAAAIAAIVAEGKLWKCQREQQQSDVFHGSHRGTAWVELPCRYR